MKAAEGDFQTEVSQGAPEVMEQVARLPGEKAQVMGQFMITEQMEHVTGDRVLQLAKRFEPAEMVGVKKSKQVNMVIKDKEKVDTSRMSGKGTGSRKTLVAGRKPRGKQPVGLGIEKGFVQSRLDSFVEKMGLGLVGNKVNFKRKQQGDMEEQVKSNAKRRKGELVHGTQLARFVER